MINDIKSHQRNGKENTIQLLIAKRGDPVRSSLQSMRAAFHQMRPITPPIVNKLISCPEQPTAPAHIGNVLNDPYKTYWFEAMYAAYDKMHNS